MGENFDKVMDMFNENVAAQSAQPPVQHQPRHVHPPPPVQHQKKHTRPPPPVHEIEHDQSEEEIEYDQSEEEIVHGQPPQPPVQHRIRHVQPPQSSVRRPRYTRTETVSRSTPDSYYRKEVVRQPRTIRAPRKFIEEEYYEDEYEDDYVRPVRRRQDTIDSMFKRLDAKIDQRLDQIESRLNTGAPLVPIQRNPYDQYTDTRTATFGKVTATFTADPVTMGELIGIVNSQSSITNPQSRFATLSPNTFNPSDVIGIKVFLLGKGYSEQMISEALKDVTQLEKMLTYAGGKLIRTSNLLM